MSYSRLSKSTMGKEELCLHNEEILPTTKFFLTKHHNLQDYNFNLLLFLVNSPKKHVQLLGLLTLTPIILVLLSTLLSLLPTLLIIDVCLNTKKIISNCLSSKIENNKPLCVQDLDMQSTMRDIYTDSDSSLSSINMAANDSLPLHKARVILVHESSIGYIKPTF